MPGDPVRLGPFTDGINTLSDPTALQDTELVDCVNFDLDIDGSLISRPPVAELTHGGAAWGGRMLMLMWAVIGGNYYLIGSTNTAVWFYTGGVWTKIADVKSTAAVQYDNKVWIIATPDSPNNGGNWAPIGGWTAVAALPRGGAAVSHKERLYVVPGELANTNETLLRFSDPADFNTWPGINQAFIAKGDGQKLVDIVVYNDNLMLFKERSTYVLAFDSDPSNAVVRQVNAVIGVTTKHCVAAYENNLYLFNEGMVYEIVNYDFAPLNTKVPFQYDPTAPSSWQDPISLSLVGDRLVVRYYNRVYVFGFRTRIWTRYELPFYTGRFIENPQNANLASLAEFWAGASIAGVTTKFYKIKNGFDNSTTEAITSSIRTKNYDLAIPHRFKRLFWWGADISTVQPVIGRATPIIFNFTVTWDQLALYSWDDLYTWDQPLTVPFSAETNITQTGGAFRRFAKFLKSLRFRQINFEMVLTNDGTVSTAPCRLFSLTALIGTKQTVDKGLS